MIGTGSQGLLNLLGKGLAMPAMIVQALPSMLSKTSARTSMVAEVSQGPLRLRGTRLKLASVAFDAL